MHRQELIEFFTLFSNGGYEKSGWFDPSNGLCDNWFEFLGHEDIPYTKLDALRNVLGKEDVYWHDWRNFSGKENYPIPVTSGDFKKYLFAEPSNPYPEARLFYMLSSTKNKLWMGDQGRLRIHLCRWILSELENG